MRAATPAGTRRTLAAGLVFLAVAAFGACDGASPVAPSEPKPHATAADSVPGDSVPGDTLHLPGDTTSVPGDTTHVPGDTTSVPGDTTHIPGDTTSVPGDTTHVPGDTISVPGDTTHVPGDTTSVPGDTTHVPGDTTSVPGDTIPGDTTAAARGKLVVRVTAVLDSASMPLAGVIVTVSRGASNHVVATGTTSSGGPLRLVLGPGVYTVRLAALPPGWHLEGGSTGAYSVHVLTRSTATVAFRLVR